MALWFSRCILGGLGRSSLSRLRDKNLEALSYGQSVVLKVETHPHDRVLLSSFSSVGAWAAVGRLLDSVMANWQTVSYVMMHEVNQHTIP